MLSLFDDEPVVPVGFAYKPGIFTHAEEKEITEIISHMDPKNMLFHGYVAKRKTANFGYDWSFENRTLTKGKDIPVVFDTLGQKATAAFDIDPAAIAELLVTEYPVESVINWHRDAPPYDKIIGLSFLSSCTFRFRPYEKSKQGRHSTVAVAVAPRSVYMLAGEARSQWEHSIEPVKRKRYSITLRTLADNAG